MNLGVDVTTIQEPQAFDESASFDLTSADGLRKAGELTLWGTAVERLAFISQWLREELRIADVGDRTVTEALADIIRQIGEALAMEVSHRDPGPGHGIDPTDTTPTRQKLMTLVHGTRA